MDTLTDANAFTCTQKDICIGQTHLRDFKREPKYKQKVTKIYMYIPGPLKEYGHGTENMARRQTDQNIKIYI